MQEWSTQVRTCAPRLRLVNQLVVWCLPRLGHGIVHTILDRLTAAAADVVSTCLRALRALHEWCFATVITRILAPLDAHETVVHLYRPLILRKARTTLLACAHDSHSVLFVAQIMADFIVTIFATRSCTKLALLVTERGQLGIFDRGISNVEGKLGELFLRQRRTTVVLVNERWERAVACLLYTSDAADE